MISTLYCYQLEYSQAIWNSDFLQFFAESNIVSDTELQEDGKER